MKKLYLFNRKTGCLMDYDLHQEAEALQQTQDLIEFGSGLILPHFTLIRGEEIPLALDDGKVVVKHEPQEMEFP